MVLNPDFPKGYIRYILALKACGETELLEKMRDEYHRRFPSSKDRDLLKKALETGKMVSHWSLVVMRIILSNFIGQWLSCDLF